MRAWTTSGCAFFLKPNIVCLEMNHSSGAEQRMLAHDNIIHATEEPSSGATGSPPHIIVY